MNELIAKFIAPTPLLLHFSVDNSGGNSDCKSPTKQMNRNSYISPCCLSSLTCLTASVQSGTSLSGVAGALDVLQRTVRWGFERCDFVCECCEKLAEADCGAGMALAVRVLNSLKFSGAESDLRFVPVQLVCQLNFADAEVFQSEYDRHFPVKGTETPPVVPWISSDRTAQYHQVVGIVSLASKTVRLWDFGQWLLPCADPTLEGAVQAVRLVCGPDSVGREVSACSDSFNWQGVTLQINKWFKAGQQQVTLAKKSVAVDALKGFRKVRKSHQSVLTNLFSASDVSNSSLLKEASREPTGVSVVSQSAALPRSTVCISGCHMSANPCSGVGVARAVRSALQHSVTLVGMDHNADPQTGLTDFSFDHCLDLFESTTPDQSQPQQQQQQQRSVSSASEDREGEGDSDVVNSAEKRRFNSLVRSMQHFDLKAGVTYGAGMGNTYYVPCTDNDVELVAKCTAQCVSTDISVMNRILSPSLSALDRIAKPTISAAVTHLGMKIAPYMSLDTTESVKTNTTCTTSTTGMLLHSITTMRSERAEAVSIVTLEQKAYVFCNAHGYPILVKGRKQFAEVCGNWLAVASAIKNSWAKDGFIQRIVPGTDKGIAFAAYRGELLGAMVCSKTVSDRTRKLWCGELEAVSPKVLQGVKEFIRESNWTGGGEIEFVEDVAGDCWAIDWNPRFPSWIFASTYTRCNLPALLITAAIKGKGENGVLSAVESVSFTKTVIEIPRANCHLSGRNDLITAVNTSNNATSKAMSAQSEAQQLQRGLAAKKVQPADGDLRQLCSIALENVLSYEVAVDKMNVVAGTKTLVAPTPRYLLSSQLVRAALQLHSKVLSECADLALRSANHTGGHTTAFSSPAAPTFQLQMCLSVKTQPHRTVLQTARSHGFLGECISLAEVRACLAAEYAPREIVLTGPGKFWDNKPNDPMPHVNKNTPLKAIFADSLVDLQRIITRVLDPQDWLNCEVVGIRFAPAWIAESRFGVNGKCPKHLMAAADMISALPSRIRIGTHFHHASSNSGACAWFDLAKAFLSLSVCLAQLSGRNIAVLDFGGGWCADFVSQGNNRSGLTELLREVARKVPQLRAVDETLLTGVTADDVPSFAAQGVLTVQFELGKSITERAGGVLARILEIRELGEGELPVMKVESRSGMMSCKDESSRLVRSDDSPTISSTSVDTSGSDSSTQCHPIPDDHAEKSTTVVARRGIILDCTIGDVSAIHTYPHPILWLDPATQLWEHVTPGGGDRLLGRTCMEFEEFSGHSGCSLPERAAVGDYVLIAHTGAYESSMQYGFGDGVDRAHLDIV